jgi:hypothetical protein
VRQFVFLSESYDVLPQAVPKHSATLWRYATSILFYTHVGRYFCRTGANKHKLKFQRFIQMHEATHDLMFDRQSHASDQLARANAQRDFITCIELNRVP